MGKGLGPLMVHQHSWYNLDLTIRCGIKMAYCRLVADNSFAQVEISCSLMLSLMPSVRATLHLDKATRNSEQESKGNE